MTAHYNGRLNTPVLSDFDLYFNVTADARLPCQRRVGGIEKADHINVALCISERESVCAKEILPTATATKSTARPISLTGASTPKNDPFQGGWRNQAIPLADDIPQP